LTRKLGLAPAGSPYGVIETALRDAGLELVWHQDYDCQAFILAVAGSVTIADVGEPHEMSGNTLPPFLLHLQVRAVRRQYLLDACARLGIVDANPQWHLVARFS
jgi:hypothetical protein